MTSRSQCSKSLHSKTIGLYGRNSKKALITQKIYAELQHLTMLSHFGKFGIVCHTLNSAISFIIQKRLCKKLSKWMVLTNRLTLYLFSSKGLSLNGRINAIMEALYLIGKCPNIWIWPKQQKNGLSLFC